ncbi:c-type cytochrome [Sphingobacterium sp. HJSM2_6]|uniref:c-type cytochrome n=1 Tax=Sphingobacterium sp. HJSM2_6 TaxID=3366264 RepID=UPI003BCA648A
MNRKILIIFALCGLVVGLSAFQPGNQPEKPKNLKVLPKNISQEDLEKTMRAFNVALGVKCGHCHAPKANGERGLDFVSDANPMKNVAREMMKMTDKINKKHFKHEHEGLIKNISCNTCHNGKAEPFTIVKN